MKTYALDTETFYSSDCSITVAGLDAYVRHPDFSCYLLTIAGDDGYKYAGPPEAFDWSLLDGATVLSHNAAFDEGIVNWMVQKGQVPSFAPAAWHCTADMTAYFGIPRSLKSACAHLLGVEMSKATRDDMKGKRWEDMSPEFRDEVLKYATGDAERCLELWQKFGDQWPEQERRISVLTRKSAQRGLHVNTEALAAADLRLSAMLGDIEGRIPWVPEDKLLSFPAFCRAVRLLGIDPPASLDKKSPETAAWCAQHPEVTWVQDMQDYRSANALREKLRSIAARVREDGTVATPLLYFGGHTGRDSGTGGVNFQNLPRGEVLGVNIRSMLQARPGHVLVAADLSAIEPRALLHLARDFATLREIAKTTDLYEGQARAWGLYSDPRPLKEGDPDLRHKVKGMSIGAGYGMSARKFAEVTGKTVAEAEEVIALFRAKNQPIVRLWDKLNNGLRTSLGGSFSVKMPSGRSMHYRGLAMTAPSEGQRSSLSCLFPKQDLVRMRVWHGTVVENCLGGETEVLTDAGWKRLDAVSVRDKVWDGEEWVSHDGVVSKGTQETIDVFGVRATPDHRFLMDSGWTTAADLLRRVAGTMHPTDSPRTGDEETGSKAEVFDIVNAGPRHRFTVRGKAGKELIASNCTQAYARDIFMHKVLAAEDAGLPVVLRVHDEVVCEVPENDAREAARTLQEIMTAPMPYAPELPLASSVNVAKTYYDAK